jgi:glutathione synthase/RimK-type ligase-like ATP-grasp enzyme
VTDQSVLVNPARVIEWCLDKVHQKGLAAAGVPTIPTKWVSPEDTFSALPPREFVVKPSVSAGGRSTARYTPGDPAALGHVRELQEAGQTVMVQEYLARIDEEGEANLVFFDGIFSMSATVWSTGHGSGWLGPDWWRLAPTSLRRPA